MSSQPLQHDRRPELRYGALLGALLRASRRCPDNTGSTGARAPLWGVTVQNLGSAPTGGLAGADRQRGAES